MLTTLARLKFLEGALGEDDCRLSNGTLRKYTSTSNAMVGMYFSLSLPLYSPVCPKIQ